MKVLVFVNIPRHDYQLPFHDTEAAFYGILQHTVIFTMQDEENWTA